MTTLLFPLYVYPARRGAAWDRFIDVVRSHPAMNVLAVVNPNNGPGQRRNEDYVLGIENLSSTGVQMAGYVHTNYGNRPKTEVEHDISKWRELYPCVSRVFIDNMSNAPGLERYYSALTAHAKSSGFSSVMGNPGALIPRSYFGTVDSAIIYEGRGYPSSAESLDPEGWYRRNPGSFGMIVHGAGSFDEAFVRSASRLFEFICVTERYEAFPRYLDGLASCISSV